MQLFPIGPSLKTSIYLIPPRLQNFSRYRRSSDRDPDSQSEDCQQQLSLVEMVAQNVECSGGGCSGSKQIESGGDDHGGGFEQRGSRHDRFGTHHLRKGKVIKMTKISLDKYTKMTG